MKLDLGALPSRIGKALQSVFGSANKRALANYHPVVKAVNARADWAKALSPEQMKARVAEWRDKVKKGEARLDDALPEMFALTREAAVRTLGLRHFDVQLIGGAVLHEGKIAEMATGEGKTLVATLPAALNAIAGESVYVVTVNDYLAKRDRDWMAPVYEYLGLTVGAIQSTMSPQERHSHYASDITYGTNNEFGFDYLRDNMKWRAEDQVQKKLSYAIVDEVDSILIDEARTPLIISGEGEGSTERYVHADRVARQLKEETHFEIKLKEHQCLLTDDGIVRAEQLVGVDSFYANPALMEWPHLLETALRAHHVYQRDKHYVVTPKQGLEGKQGDPEVIIVDEFTGRLMPGRRWSDGLHQAVEAKEGITPREETRTFATITLQNYFRMFHKLAGMTGTAMTEAAEFSRIYNLDVVSIPTNRPMVRKDYNDHIYLDENSKLDAIVAEIQREHARGRPILLGTTSIAKSEAIATRLQEIGVPHNVLNAKQHAREAEVVMQAGRRGTITVATNMAGRGTDIVLGGKAEALWRTEVQQKGWREDQAEAQARLEELRQHCAKEHDEILALGGLLVVGTERHEARRIDNQLRGRCGRQGDPGETRFFLSFDDDLMKIFARDWVKVMMEKMGLKAGEVIDSPMVTRGIARAQRKVEARNFDIRKHLIEYDEVMDKQRKFVYGARQETLEYKGLRDKSLGMFEEVFEPVLERCAGDKDELVQFEELRKWLHHRCGNALELEGIEQVEREQLFDWIMQRVEQLFERRKENYGEKEWDGIQRFLVLDTIDNKWKDHLHAMDVLRGGVGLRSYAQIDPKNEFKKEGFEKFQLLKMEIADQVSNFLFKQEATDTIRDLITGRLRQQPPPPPPNAMQLPRSEQEVQALFESLVAAGQVPQEVLDRIAKGERFVMQVTPQGLVLRPAAPAAPATGTGTGGSPQPAAASATAEKGATGDTAAAASERQTAAAPTPQPAATASAPMPAAAAAGPAAKRATARRPNGPKPGRNDPCPCGSGIKYKKCCAPAFD
jgi:preprotein translocase subunit SecA